MLDVYFIFKLQKHTFKRRGDRHPRLGEHARRKFAENTTQAVANRGLSQRPCTAAKTLNKKRAMLFPWRHTGRCLTDLGFSVAQSHG